MRATPSRPHKTERLHILVDPKFKRFLQAEAKRTGLSVAQVVRQRFEQHPSEDETLLATLTTELNRRVAEVSAATDQTIALVDEVLRECREARARREKAASRTAATGPTVPA